MGGCHVFIGKVLPFKGSGGPGNGMGASCIAAFRLHIAAHHSGSRCLHRKAVKADVIHKKAQGEIAAGKIIEAMARYGSPILFRLQAGKEKAVMAEGKSKGCLVYAVIFIGKMLAGQSAGGRGIIKGTGKIHISLHCAGSTIIGQELFHFHLVKIHIPLKNRSIRRCIYRKSTG